jgi:hypothetical protein
MTTATVSPGTVYPTVYLIATDASGTPITGNLAVASLQDITINNANDVFTYTQLNLDGKRQIATTSTNSIATNMVVDNTIFFGDNAVVTAGAATKLGIFGLSRAKTLCNFTITHVGDKTMTGNCYITGLAPTVSADSPVWLSPVTLTVDGSFTVA